MDRRGVSDKEWLEENGFKNLAHFLETVGASNAMEGVRTLRAMKEETQSYEGTRGVLEGFREGNFRPAKPAEVETFEDLIREIKGIDSSGPPEPPKDPEKLRITDGGNRSKF